MKKIIATLLFALFCGASGMAQTKVTQKGKELTEIKTERKSQDTKTELVFVSKSGEKYEVYKSAKGKYFYWKISKKTGEKYKCYIEVTE